MASKYQGLYKNNCAWNKPITKRLQHDCLAVRKMGMTERLVEWVSWKAWETDGSRWGMSMAPISTTIKAGIRIRLAITCRSAKASHPWIGNYITSNDSNLLQCDNLAAIKLAQPKFEILLTNQFPHFCHT